MPQQVSITQVFVPLCFICLINNTCWYPNFVNNKICIFCRNISKICVSSKRTFVLCHNHPTSFWQISKLLCNPFFVTLCKMTPPHTDIVLPDVWCRIFFYFRLQLHSYIQHLKIWRDIIYRKRIWFYLHQWLGKCNTSYIMIIVYSQVSEEIEEDCEDEIMIIFLKCLTAKLHSKYYHLDLKWIQSSSNKSKISTNFTMSISRWYKDRN